MKKSLETLRHSTAHILAIAIKELYPKAKLGIGPAIESGFYYDFANLEVSPEDLPKIEKKMQEIIDKKLNFKKINVTKDKAKLLLKDEPYKLDLLDELKEVSFYETGDFKDMCKGPHIKNTSDIKAFKLVSIAGAYWRGDSSKPMLTRIYGVVFENKEELKKYLMQKEEAEKRNHLKLGKQLDLFSFHNEGPGFPFLHPKGMIIWDELLKLWEEEHKKENYQQVKTPIILNQKLWEISGHWDHYKENMYFTKIDNNDYAVKPMNCPGGILIYKSRLHSYKELPLRIAELGLVHRHELSGVLNGLFRVRTFTQDDAHIYCMEEQIEEEVISIIKLIDRIYKVFNLPYYIELSTRPSKSIGSDVMWKTAETALKSALKKIKAKYKLNPAGGAFYGPKIDFHIKDALDRTWQCATIQLDFAMPERFDLTYEGQDGRKHRPVMLHRTIYGAIERFLGILIEHYAGKFPLWLAPVQIRLLSLTDRNKKYVEKLEKEFKEFGIRVDVDTRSESMGKKVRDAQAELIPIIVTIGDKEQKSKTLAVRTLDGKVSFGIKTKIFLEKVQNSIKQRKDAKY